MTPWPSRSATCPALLLCAVASLIGCVGGSSSNPGGGVGVGGDVFVPAGFDALSDGDGPGSLDTGAAATDGAATDTSARTTNDVPATPKDTAQLVGDGGCTLGAARCHDGKRQLCAKAGWSDTPCTLDAPVCVAGKCHVCAPGKPFCSQPLAGATHGMKAFSCSDDGATSTLTAVCKDGPCKDGQCMACFAGKHRCHEGQREVCAGGGLLWAPDHCPKSTPACVDGACKVCAPSSKSCGKDGAGDDAVVLCDDTGSKGTIVAVCKAPAFCESGACVQCKPGTAKCVDGALVTCKPDGTGFAVAPCPAAKPVCDGGTCKLCKADASFCQQATADAPPR